MVTFQELGLREDLLSGISALGFQSPTPVQELVIPAALQSEDDFIALAQTGTGKTAAFGLPLLQRTDAALRQVQSLILCPTRELCVQVAGDLENYAKFAQQYKVVAVYGGAPIEAQVRQLRAGAQIIVATPGRLVDLLQRQDVNLDFVKCVVLDEADEMLNMGFKDALDLILEAIPTQRSIWLFSATMPEEVRRIAKAYMRKPHELSVDQNTSVNTNILHEYYLCRTEDRYSTLKRIVDALPGIYGLIFCRTKNEAKEVAEQMIRDGYNADALHGDLVQADRDRVMNRFREGLLELLIATDVAARGIDVSEISHVINYNLPDETEVYTHRSGRTGRAGHMGVSISIVTPKQEERIRHIERKLRTTVQRKSIPSGVEVCEKQLFHIVRNIHDQKVEDADIGPFLPRIFEELKDLSKEELIKRFASVEFNRFLAYYRNAPDINIYPRGSAAGKAAHAAASAHSNGSTAGMQRLFVNIGMMDGVTKKEFLSLLTRELGLPGTAVGHIDLKKTCLHVDVSERFVDKLRKGLEEFSLNGRPVRVDDAKPQDGGKPKYSGGFDKKYGKERR